MPHVTTTITTTPTDVPVETIRTLQTELATVGLPVVGAEAGDTPRFGADTQARVREFQKRYRLPETEEVDEGTGGVMSLSAVVPTESDRSQLREKLKNAVNDVPDSPEYNYWLARYAILAGDYVTAKATIQRVHDFRVQDLDDLNTIIDPGPQPQAFEVPYLENLSICPEDLLGQSRFS
jgi:peptidoglycan hydrolase-like protein with peptidoglycan-binding domain